MAAVKTKSITGFTPEQEGKRDLYRNDRLLFFKECLRVKDREGNGLVPFEPLEGQSSLLRLIEKVEEFHAQVSKDIGEEYKKPVNIQILKARRGGFSTLIEALLFHFCEFNQSSNGLVVAHQATNADNVLQISRRFATQIPDEFKQFKIPTAKMGEILEWGDVNGKSWDSRIVIATANSKNFARGYDFNFIHLSECAHYSSGDAIASAKDAALFARYIFEESTANGTDAYFYKTWQQSKYLHEIKAHWNKFGEMPKDWSGKYKFFYGWYEDSAYRTGMSETAKSRLMLDLDDDEKAGVATFGWKPEQIEWRRRKIAGDCSEQTSMDPVDYFRQEYPSSPEEAFVFSGKAVFPSMYLESVQRSGQMPKSHGSIVAFDADGAVVKYGTGKDYQLSPFVLWEEPKEKHQYVIGCKCSDGERGEESVVIVFDRMDGERLREVAVYRGAAGAVHLGDIALWLGYKYHTAFIVPDATKSAVTAQRIAGKGYPLLYMRKNEEKIGDGSTVKTHLVPGLRVANMYREMVVDHAADSFAKDELTIKTKWLARELSMFANIDGDRTAPPGEQENGVLAVCLAIYGHRQSAPKVIVPDDLKGEVVEEPINTEDAYARMVWEDVRKKKKKEAKRNERLVQNRELNSKIKLSRLFK